MKRIISKLKRILGLLILLILIVQNSNLILAQSGRAYRRRGIHAGNMVKTVFGNWGVVAQPADKGPRAAWIYDNNGYIGDVSPMVGVEVNATDENGEPVTFHSVVVSPVDRPTLGGDEVGPDGKQWGFEPVKGYYNSQIPESQQRIAMSDNPESWPQSWPDKDATWNGAWNGYFGKQSNASVESYYVMDDDNDEEFNQANYNDFNVSFQPDSMNPTRKGLGLKVRVRGLQWAQFLAQDVIFWLYEVENTSTTDYDKVTFGSLVGTYVGVTSTEDFGEYDDDWSFFDVEKDLTYSGDFDNSVARNPNWVGSDVGMVGYAFLESPGNPYDGIDNDRDANGSAPYFDEDSFVERVLSEGDKVVTINDNYERTIVTITNTKQKITTRGGYSLELAAGDTIAPEGNEITAPDQENRKIINPNALDGIDNDLDGLIDENYYLHYRQIRKDQDGNILFDIINPTQFVDYINDIGINDLLIDERRDDGIDNDGDWDPKFHDVGTDGIADSDDPDGTEGNGQPDPGEPKFDETDPDESDQIGLTAFNYFAPAGDFPMKNDEELWKMMAPGYFDVPSSIQNGQPVGGEDGDFIYSSGYFPLRAGQTERFSIGLLYGNDKADLNRNLITVKDIYDNEYSFPTAPLKPTVQAVAGDGYVRLYWNRLAEESIDPVLNVKDFEGYKIYKATDPNFNDARVVTDSRGVVQGYKCIEQFDKDNGIKGEFYPSKELLEETDGYGFHLGEDTGLRHSYIDNDVINGRTYYYAVVSYDRGDSDKNIFPSENTKKISISTTGEITTDKNTLVITPGPKAPGYTSSEGEIVLHSEKKIGSGSVTANIIDPSALKDHTYKLTFLDEATDGVDNDNDWTLADDLNGNNQPDEGEPNYEFRDPQELRRLTTSYSVLDTNHYTITFQHNDTIFTPIGFKNIRKESIVLKDYNDNLIPEQDYTVRESSGFVKGNSENAFTTDSLKFIFQYYPVYKSKKIKGSPFAEETEDSDIFDGIQLSFENIWNVGVIDSLTGWNFYGGYDIDFGVAQFDLGGRTFKPVKYPADYSIEFFDEVVDTVNDKEFLVDYFGGDYFAGLFDIPVNFKVVNESGDYRPQLFFSDNDMNSKISKSDQLFMFDKDNRGNYFMTWQIIFKRSQIYPDSSFQLGAGDKLEIRTQKSFRKGDEFYFHPDVPEINEEKLKQDLDEINVYPNPYVAANILEPPLPPGKTSGRGERRIYFSNIPHGSKIHIFTTRGSRIRTIKNDQSIEKGFLSWNLKTKENLDVAPGVYFYVVETPSSGMKRGKLAIIK
ncbi:MAG: hypothetical protein K9M80_04775 [Candidatus Marinimicrobia bacterium]|nr:hypothetical protein [Candidatus Neomarinimicrobiota bacterium]